MPADSEGLRPHSVGPDAWRRHLTVAAPDLDVSDAEWIANLNEPTPWRAVVGHLRLRDGQELILKYHDDFADLQREAATHRFLTRVGAARLAPRILGVSETCKVIVLERIIGSDLGEILDEPEALTIWLQAAQAVGTLHLQTSSHTQTWLSLCADDISASRLPGYSLPIDQLLIPLEGYARDHDALSEAVSWVQRVVADPGEWLGFTHADLQTRHIIWNPDGLRFLDWERAGLKHTLYDLACLLDKPGLLGKRLPQWAEDAAIVEYASAAGLSPDRVRSALAPVLTYERLIGLAEPPPDPINDRICLESLVALPDDEPNLTPVREAAIRFLDHTPELPIRTFDGLTRSGNPTNGGTPRLRR